MMKKNLLLFVILIFIINACYGQNPVPKNLNQALKILQRDCSDSLKSLIKVTADNNLIYVSYPWGGNYKTINEWFDNDNTDVKINKYLNERNVIYIPHQQKVILIAFKRKLLGQSVEENKILKLFQDTEKIWNHEDDIRFTTDSLRGIYIPKDIDDCFKQIDKFWNDSTKNMVRSWSEDKFVSQVFRGFGMWLRNNWGLWAGSRLTKYFNTMNVYNAESISGIILISYHRYVMGQPIKLKEQTNADTEYWEKAKQKEIEDERLKFATYNTGDTLDYKYKSGFVSDKQELNYNSNSCISMGLVLEKDATKLYLKVRIIQTCDTRGIVIYDSKNSLIYNKELKKWIKIRKRIITIAHKNEELWFKYDDWESNN